MEVTCDQFTFTLYFNEQYELREGEVTIRDDNDQPVQIFGVILVADGEAFFCYPWETVQRFDAAQRSITFVRGAELIQLHDEAVELRVEKWRMCIAPEKIKRIDVTFVATP